MALLRVARYLTRLTATLTAAILFSSSLMSLMQRIDGRTPESTIPKRFYPNDFGQFLLKLGLQESKTTLFSFSLTFPRCLLCLLTLLASSRQQFTTAEGRKPFQNQKLANSA